MVIINLNAEIYAAIDSEELNKIIERYPGLKAYIEMEMDSVKKGNDCPGCGSSCSSHCGSSCGKNEADASSLTCSLISIFNYFIPNDIKDSINMMGTVFVDK